MTSRYRINVIRRGRRPDEARYRQTVGDLCGLDSGSVDALPPAVPVGWKEPAQVGGGLTYCLACSPQPPTAAHVRVHEDSYLATRPCGVCGRRLDHVLG